MYGKLLWSGTPPFCNKGTTTDQNVRIVAKYIRDNPEHAHGSTGLLFLDAMEKAAVRSAHNALEWGSAETLV
jgi:hypothetical protein